MKIQQCKAAQQGMTLIEILIAMLIGVVLLGGILSIFTNSKQTYRMQEAMSRIQENSRFAMDFISRDLRIADFWGCMRRDSGGPTNNIDITDGAYDATIHDFFNAGGLDGVQGIPDGTNSGLDAPDTLTIRGATSAGVFVTTAMGATSDALTATAHGFSAGTTDFLFITDCNDGDYFQPSGVNSNTISHASGGSPGNTNGNLSTVYGTDAQIFSASTIVYSVKDTDGDGVNSLYRSINGAEDELIEGVENMQILFGEDTDADEAANYYVPAGTAGLNMAQVVAIRISLLLQSTDNNIAAKNVSVNFNGGNSTSDRRLRRVVTSTIAIRNRL